MSLETVLTEENKEDINKIGQADILIGIPSYKSEKTIGHVISAAQYGLAKYFPFLKAVIMSSDGGSPDKTQEIAKKTDVYTNLDKILVEHPVYPARNLVINYPGTPNSTNAIRAIFEVARELNVKVCLILDSTLQSIDPKWIELLAGPILHVGYDYVTPYYYCTKYDGMINSIVVYPFIRALYGKRIRQPMTGELGLSRKAVDFFLNKKVWEISGSSNTINLSMVVSAISEGYKVCQAFLGVKVCMNKSGDVFDNVGSNFNEIVGTLFETTFLYREKWKKIKNSSSSKIYGFRSEVSPEGADLSWESLYEKFKKEAPFFFNLWSKILSSSLYKEVKKLNEASSFKFDTNLWSKILYEFTIAYNTNNIDKTKILDALLPLYYAQLAFFIRETSSMSISQTEKVIEKLCQSFEEEKPYFLEKWNALIG